VVFPLESRNLVGGQPLRVTIYLVDSDEQPLAGATVEAELWTPDGELFAAFPCADGGQGRYLSDYVQLPLRGGAGTWRVVARAQWGAGQATRASSNFPVVPSFSEELQGRHGFWVDTASPLFDYYVTNINDPDSKLHPYPDGDGAVVFLANTRVEQSYEIFVIMDIHWRHADSPTDEAAALAYVGSLIGPHNIKLDIPPEDLAARALSFHGGPAWQVTGRWKSMPINDNPHPGGLVEWLVFPCPGSDWLWSVVIASNQLSYMDELRALRESFECPAPASGAY